MGGASPEGLLSAPACAAERIATESLAVAAGDFRVHGHAEIIGDWRALPIEYGCCIERFQIRSMTPA